MENKRIEFQQHQNYILHIIHQLIIEASGISEEDFRKNEPLKERVTSQLQDIGQAAYEILQLNKDNSIEFDKSIYDKLSLLRNSKFHQEAEFGLIGGVWNIVKNDIKEFERLLEEDMLSNI